MTPLESFSEGTPFQPLVICFVYRVMMWNGRTLRIAKASSGRKAVVVSLLSTDLSGPLFTSFEIQLRSIERFQLFSMSDIGSHLDI